MTIYADHWLYNYIPQNQEELLKKPCWQRITWALFGNDDDGIFGEGPHSGHRWIEKWDGKINKEIKIFEPGKICFTRFLSWQIRNPLHNFTAYVIGFKNAVNVSFTQLALITTKEISFYQKLRKVSVFPMNDSSGVYIGLHNNRPFISLRCKVMNKWLESYAGWRPRGGFGLAFRLKDSIKVKECPVVRM
ncbi:MAG: hypothetical protein H0T62_00100 [Parachlamydiaceae bacterium]|nr:hypothetical protein [Parachlamydiaceae bacterium]